MFDLEQAIADWRNRMNAAGITASNDLDELESHLRETIALEMRLGADDRKALEVATQKIGAAEALKTEFMKSKRHTEWTSMKQNIFLAAAVCSTLLGIHAILPALGRHFQHLGAWTGDEIYAFGLGCTLAVFGSGAVFYFAQKRVKNRRQKIAARVAVVAGLYYFVWEIIVLWGMLRLASIGRTSVLTPVFMVTATFVTGWYILVCFRFNRAILEASPRTTQ
jgi:hypothetical protein